MDEERYRFLVDWYDETIKVKRSFLLSYYPSDGSVSMFDIVTKKTFLRRTKCHNVEMSDLFIGSVINVLSRQLYLAEFGDEKTKEKFSRDVEDTIFIINESGFKCMGEIISVLENNSLVLNKGKLMDKSKSGFHLSSFSEHLENLFLLFEIRGQSAVNIVRKLLHPEAPIEKPVFVELGDLRCNCLGPSDETVAKREMKHFFPNSGEIHSNTACFKNSTACIIKPHAMREKLVGKIIQDILNAGFKISALEIITFNISTATEFLDVYKGVVPEYKDMVSQLMSGSCVAMEISSSLNSRAIIDFRTFVGPSDPEIAKKLRPKTLRAHYGHDKVKNAIHCTDLPGDEYIELDYLFKIMPA